MEANVGKMSLKELSNRLNIYGKKHGKYYHFKRIGKGPVMLRWKELYD
jgi:hypothetical protein